MGKGIRELRAKNGERIRDIKNDSVRQQADALYLRKTPRSKGKNS